MLNPFAPHMTEEIWEQQGFGGMLNQQKWVGFDPEKCAEATVEIVVQLAGKIKARLHLAADSSKEEVLAAAKAETRGRRTDPRKVCCERDLCSGKTGKSGCKIMQYFACTFL